MVSGLDGRRLTKHFSNWGSGWENGSTSCEHRQHTEHLECLPDRLFIDNMVRRIWVATVLYTLHVLHEIESRVQNNDHYIVIPATWWIASLQHPVAGSTKACLSKSKIKTYSTYHSREQDCSMSGRRHCLKLAVRCQRGSDRDRRAGKNGRMRGTHLRFVTIDEAESVTFSESSRNVRSELLAVQCFLLPMHYISSSSQPFPSAPFTLDDGPPRPLLY